MNNFSPAAVYINRMKSGVNKKDFEALYRKYNRREFVHPDPLEFLYNYNTTADREIVGLVSSSLAYGRVAQILKSVSAVLGAMGPSPAAFLEKATPRALAAKYRGFKHRFTSGDELAGMLLGAKRALAEFGSLEECFAAGLPAGADTVAPALAPFAARLNLEAGCARSSLVPAPECGSACKRLNLFLRWMVRRDAVDPGGWDTVSPALLIVPLDTHMHKICTALGLTQRKPADLRTALEITAAFKSINPRDPVKYDFAITRLGIRSDCDPSEIVGCGIYSNHVKELDVFGLGP